MGWSSAGLALVFTCLAGMTATRVQAKIDITCEPLEGNTIDWECIFGSGSLSEVNKYVSKDSKKEKADFTSCKEGKDRPCSRFIVPKNVQRAETKVTFGPEGFPFLKNERYVFKYSFRATDDMKVAKKFTHIGQIKGAYHGKQTVDGDPIVSISANLEHGLHVRFANQDTIEDYYTHDDWARDWDDATGKWVHVTITTVFGQSMEVELAGGVTGTFEWPKHLTPVAWNDKGKMARMKLGLYHKEEMVGDADVEIRDISIEGPNGIIRTSPENKAPSPSPSPSPSKPVPSPSPSPSPSPNQSPSSSSDSGKTETYCAPLADNQIDWDCVFGPDSLEEVDQKGGYMTTCPKAHNYACSLFVVKKEEERSEVKVQEGPEGFGFYKGESYTFKYSFRAKEGMKVAKKYTHLGQLKGSIGKGGGYMIKNDPIYSLTANNDGLMVRFSNLDKTIEDYHEGLEKHLDWGDSTGQWVHVRIRTTFGESMEVLLTGAVEGKAVWPSKLAPVAWHRDADRVRMKLGLYHKKGEVHDGEVEFKDITIEGPNGIVTTVKGLDSEGHLYLGCYEDDRDERILSKKYVDAHMTTAMCADLCEDSKYFGTQYANECWCSDSNDQPDRHGKSSKCTMRCAGGGTINKCGGHYAMDVYEHEGDPDDIPKDTKHLGCFADDVQDRALKLKSTSSSRMDYDECKKFCDKEDARFFAVQYGVECFCGDKREKYDEHGPAICHMKCAGDSDQTCGGNKAMNVFRIKSD